MCITDQENKIPTGQSGCYAGFSPLFNSTKCVQTSSTYKWFYSAEADCRLRTGYTGGIFEPRERFSRDFILPLMSILLFLCERIYYIHFN